MHVNRKRLLDAIDDVSTCAISGAVGTFANINPNVENSYLFLNKTGEILFQIITDNSEM